MLIKCENLSVKYLKCVIPGVGTFEPPWGLLHEVSWIRFTVEAPGVRNSRRRCV